MKTIRKILSHISKLISYGENIRPARDWFILIVLAALFFVLSIGWNILLFRNFQTQKVSGVASTTPEQQNIGDSIPQIQNIFKDRATEEINYQQNYHFVDPSLPGS